MGLSTTAHIAASARGVKNGLSTKKVRSSAPARSIKRNCNCSLWLAMRWIIAETPIGGARHSRIFFSVSDYGDFLSQVFRLSIEGKLKNGLLIGNYLAGIVAEKYAADIGVHAVCIHAEPPRDKNGARQMERLRGDEKRCNSEDIAGAGHGAVGIKTRVVKKNILVRNTPRKQIL